MIGGPRKDATRTLMFVNPLGPPDPPSHNLPMIGGTREDGHTKNYIYKPLGSPGPQGFCSKHVVVKQWQGHSLTGDNVTPPIQSRLDMSTKSPNNICLVSSTT